MYVCMYVCMYIYREIDVCVYIYICIHVGRDRGARERERERERDRERERAHCLRGCLHVLQVSRSQPQQTAPSLQQLSRGEAGTKGA